LVRLKLPSRLACARVGLFPWVATPKWLPYMGPGERPKNPVREPRWVRPCLEKNRPGDSHAAGGMKLDRGRPRAYVEPVLRRKVQNTPSAIHGGRPAMGNADRKNRARGRETLSFYSGKERGFEDQARELYSSRKRRLGATQGLEKKKSTICGQSRENQSSPKARDQAQTRGDR